MGCFKDTITRAINGTWKEFQVEAIKNCYLRANEKGNMIFAVQDGRQCFTSPDAGETYDKYGETTGCMNGRGGFWKADVYRSAGNLIEMEVKTFLKTYYMIEFKKIERKKTAP